jgi:RNA polymerase sigma-70 factor, ECF subfamily
MDRMLAGTTVVAVGKGSAGSSTGVPGDPKDPLVAEASAVSVEEVWVEFGVGLRTFVRRRVADPHVAEDLLSEIVVRVHRHLGTLEHQERLTAWVYRIARNVIKDHYKAAGRRREVLESEPDPVVGAAGADGWVDDQEAVLVELAACLRPLLAELPDDYRRALELTDLGGLTQAEAAKLEQVSLSGMKSRVQRGRRQLAVVLRDCCTPTLDSRGLPVDFRPRPDICG